MFVRLSKKPYLIILHLFNSELYRNNMTKQIQLDAYHLRLSSACNLQLHMDLIPPFALVHPKKACFRKAQQNCWVTLWT